MQAAGEIALPEVLVQLRHSQSRMPRVLTHTEGNTEAPDKKEGQGVAIQRSHQAVACRKRYDEEPRKPRRLLIRGEQMKRAELGHVKVKNLETAWARVESGSRERSGRFARTNVEGCLMGQCSQRLGKPATRRRTPRKHAALKGNSCRTLSGWNHTSKPH